MVIKLKSKEEYNTLKVQKNVAYYGSFLSHEEICSAKAARAFDVIRHIVKQLEDAGVTVYYTCTEEIRGRGAGKWLLFVWTIKQPITNNLGDKFLTIFHGLRVGKYVEYMDVQYIEKSLDLFGRTSVGGSPTSCPLF